MHEEDALRSLARGKPAREELVGHVQLDDLRPTGVVTLRWREREPQRRHGLRSDVACGERVLHDG